MTIADLTTALETALGASVPVYFHHVFVEDGEELPPAYVVTDSTGVNPFHADNKTYYFTIINTVTVYSKNYNATLLAAVDAVLSNNNIPYDRATEYDEETLMYYTEYDINLDN